MSREKDMSGTGSEPPGPAQPASGPATPWLDRKSLITGIIAAIISGIIGALGSAFLFVARNEIKYEQTQKVKEKTDGYVREIEKNLDTVSTKAAEFTSRDGALRGDGSNPTEACRS